jgi:hypothetical protein
VTAGLWVVTELSIPLKGPPSDGEVHPETTPVGPFSSREDADSWARAYIDSFGESGSWSIAPLRLPPSTGPRS